MTRSILPLALVLLLLACADEPAPEEAQGPEEMGEVLEGSISDEMIPYDRLRSQPPRAEPLPGEGGDGAGAAPRGADAPTGETGAAPPAGEAPPAAEE